MATTKIWSVKGWIGQVVNYVENEEKTSAIKYSKSDIQSLRDVMNYAVQDYKTERQFYVSGINCLPQTARQEMLQVKKQFNKEDGIIAFHAYQSFKPGEVTPDLTHHIGIELVKEIWGDRFQVLVATHLDKAHIHNHFVLNSVSFIDGKKYNDCKKSYALLGETSDRLCKEHNLSIIENPKQSKRRSYDAWQAERDGKQTWWRIVRSDVDNAIKQSISTNAFYRHMESLGYEIKYGKHISVRPQGKQRFIRLKTLGENYTEEAIKQRILEQKRPEYPKRIETAPPKRIKIRCSFDDLFLRKITFNGIRALYFRYLNLLKKANKQTDEKIPFVLKEDLRKLDEVSRQTVLLIKNNIETDVQLDEFINTKETEIEKLCTERKVLTSKLYKLPKESADKIRIKHDLITTEIKNLRQDLKTAKGVRKREDEIEDKFTTINEMNKKKAVYKKMNKSR